MGVRNIQEGEMLTLEWPEMEHRGRPLPYRDIVLDWQAEVDKLTPKQIMIIKKVGACLCQSLREGK